MKRLDTSLFLRLVIETQIFHGMETGTTMVSSLDSLSHMQLIKQISPQLLMSNTFSIVVIRFFLMFGVIPMILLVSTPNPLSPALALVNAYSVTKHVFLFH